MNSYKDCQRLTNNTPVQLSKTFLISIKTKNTFSTTSSILLPQTGGTSAVVCNMTSPCLKEKFYLGLNLNFQITVSTLSMKSTTISNEILKKANLPSKTKRTIDYTWTIFPNTITFCYFYWS